MGSLVRFNIANCGCDVFIETGTGNGDSLNHAYINGNFDILYSIEIFKDTAKRASERFKKKKQIVIFNAKSTVGLKKVLNEIEFKKKLLVFLDAHFPGETEMNFDRSSRENQSYLPLREELEILSQYQNIENCIIIVDDLRLYEDIPNDRKNMGDTFSTLNKKHRDLSYIDSFFPNSSINRYYFDEGYLVIKPKDSSFKLTKLGILGKFKLLIHKKIERIYK